MRPLLLIVLDGWGVAAVGAGTAVVLTRDGCSSAATEESSEAVVED